MVGGWFGEVAVVDGVAAVPAGGPRLNPPAALASAARVPDQPPPLQVVNADARLGGERVVVAHHGDDRFAPERPRRQPVVADRGLQWPKCDIDSAGTQRLLE